MRVLLANPPAGSIYHRVGLRFMPLGLAYIGAVLKRGGHDVKTVDFEVERVNHGDVPYGDYDIVGISSDTTRWPAALKIAEAAKAAGVTVVAGGPHVSFLDEEALRTGLIDYVVRGEGEITMLELTERLAAGGASEVQGVSFLDGGNLVRTPARPFIEDLDSLPMPARELFDRRKYRSKLSGREMANVLSSRGCPFDCDFCSCSQFAGKRWRTRSVDNILDELEYLHRREGYRAVAFFDDNFTLDPNRAAAVSEGILSRGLDLKWWAFSRSDTAVKHPWLVKLMARAGLVQAFVGFESANQDTLDSAGKKSSVEASLEAMRVLRLYGVEVWGAFMMGFEGETEEMVKRTIKFAKKLNPAVAQFSLVTPYPGTRLFDRVRERIITSDWRKFWGGEPVIDLEALPPRRLKHLFRKAYRSYYLRPSKLSEWAPHLLKSSIRYYTERKNSLKRFMAGPLRERN